VYLLPNYDAALQNKITHDLENGGAPLVTAVRGMLKLRCVVSVSMVDGLFTGDI